MKKIIFITVFVLLGTLVNSAMAAKPVQQQEITLSGGPIHSIYSCDVANHTDQSIDVFMNYCEALTNNTGTITCWDVSPNGSGEQAPILDAIAPGHYRAGEVKVITASSLTCEITYTGDPGDITGNVCGLTAALDTACFALQPR